MVIRLYNTMHARKEDFVPREEGKVGIYCCGPTVYNYIHLGNAPPLLYLARLGCYLCAEFY